MGAITPDKAWQAAQEHMDTNVLNTRAFQEAWCLWVSDRAERRKPLTKAAMRLQILKLEGMGHAMAIASIKQSIEMGWIGLFPVKDLPLQNGSKFLPAEQWRSREGLPG